MSGDIANRAELVGKLEGLLHDAVDGGVPGISAAIGSSKGLVWQGSAGHADVLAHQNIRNDHVFGIGSITKVFAAVVILQLVDEKKLELSDTIAKILDAELYTGIDNAAQATVAQLLRHESGIDSWELDEQWILHGRGKLLNPEHSWNRTEPLEYIRRPKDQPSAPDKYSYSNTNYTFLGLIIEKLTGNPAEAEIRHRILRPLSMHHTFLEGFECESAGALPRRYHWLTQPFIEDAGICPAFSKTRSNLFDATGSNLSTEWTAGGLVTSPPDLLKLAIALQNGDLLSSASHKIMREFKTIPEERSELGHGLFRFLYPNSGEKWLGHFGSVLGFTGALLWLEKGDCAVSVLANVGSVHCGTTPYGIGSVLLSKTDFLNVALDLVAE